MLHCPTNKQLWHGLWTVKCDLVSEQATWASRHVFNCFCVNKASKLRAAMIIQVFHHFIRSIAKKISFFSDPFAKLSTVTSLVRMVENSLLSKHPLFHTIICKFLLHHKNCSLGFHYFGGGIEYPWNFPSKKTPTPLKFFLQAHCLIKCTTYCFKIKRVENGRRK